MLLSLGSILGFISVAFGAYAEHGLRSRISEHSFNQIMTALKYNQIYAVVIIILGLFLLTNSSSKLYRMINISGWLFFSGVILFSFSIYFANIFNLDQLVKVAPFGGTTLLIAWLSLAYTGFKSARK